MENLYRNFLASAWISVTARLLWYLFLLLLLFLFSHAPERGFRYWGL